MRLPRRGQPHRPPVLPRGPWRWPLVALALVSAVVLSVGVAHGGFTAAITNVGDSVQSGDLLSAGAQAGTTLCNLGTSANSPIGTANLATCSSTLGPSGTLPATTTTGTTTTGTTTTTTTATTGTPTAQTTTISSSGSLSPASATLTNASCGAVSLADSVRSTNPMLVRGGTLSYAQGGPFSGASGLGLSGGSTGTGYAASALSTAYTSSSAFSEAIWFKTTSQGTLIGQTASSSNYNPSSWDKMLWVDSSGYVVFGIYPSKVVELTSAATYNNGNWHLAVGTVSSSGISLSVDNTTVSSTSTTSAQAYTGYWHVGWDNEAQSWTDPPSTPYFAGTLADAAIFPALSASQITALYQAGSQATWTSLLSSDGAVDAWGLGDSGTTAYTGTIPNVSPSICAFVDVTVATTVGSSTTCAAPSSSTTCAAPSSSLTLASLAASTTLPPDPTPAQNLTFALTLQRDATNSTSSYPYASGLHVTDQLGIVAASGSFNATLLWPSENIIL